MKNGYQWNLGSRGLHKRQFWEHAGLVGALVAVSCLIGGSLVVLSACRSGAPQAQQFRDLSFDIAPTGDKIIFTGKGKGNWDLYFLDLTTKKVTLLAETDQWERHPQFSPDGKFILYTAADNPQDPHTAWHLFLRSVDGKTVQQLTSGSKVADDWALFVPPQGERILFARCNALIQTAWRGYVWDWNNAEYLLIKRDGTALRAAPFRWGDIFLHAFSPDGDKLLVSKPVDANSQVHLPEMLIMEINSSMFSINRTVTLGSGDTPIWSPDGKRIAFVADRKQPYAYELWIMDADGSNARQLTSLGAYITNPRFTPDGKSILFLVERDAAYELWKVDVDGRHLERIADKGLFESPLQWKP
jgi:Tol biopolymer transport system component